MLQEASISFKRDMKPPVESNYYLHDSHALVCPCPFHSSMLERTHIMLQIDFASWTSNYRPNAKGFCISNNCSTIKDIPWVVQSCMRDSTGELQPRTCIAVTLWYNTIVCTLQICIYIPVWWALLHDSKTHVAYHCTIN